MVLKHVQSCKQRLFDAFKNGCINRPDDINPIFQLLETAFYQEQVLGSGDGCYMPMPFPTGVGKTYNTLSLIIKAVLDDIELELTQGDDYEPRTIYYITNSVDNVSEAYNDLIKRVKDCTFLDDVQKTVVVERILYAPANSRSLLDLIGEKSGTLEKILMLFAVEKNASLMNSIEQLKNEQTVLQLKLSPAQKKTLTERITQTASECYSTLIRHIQNVQLGDDPVPLSNRNVELLSQLIPGIKVEIGQARVVFLTTKKFLFGLQQSKGKFHPARNLSGNILFIDEVDRQHQEILTHLVSSNDTDLLSTIRTIHSNLKEHKLCTKPQYAGIEEMFEEYLIEVKKFFEEWSLQHSFDIDASAIENDKQILLFSDKLTTHNTSVKGKLAVSFNEDNQQHEIALWGHFNERKQHDFPKFLGGLERLVNRTFQSLVRRAEEQYRENLAAILSEHELRQLTSSQAIASILDQLNLHGLRHQLNQQLNYLVGRQYSPRKSAANYHTRGIRMIEVDRLPEAQDSVMFKHHGYNVSPSGMLASWVESGCCILGVSATAECGSVIHNFDIRYLKNSLGSKFIQLSEAQRRSIHNYYDQERDYQGNGVTVVPGNVEQNYGLIRDLIGQWNPQAKNRELLYRNLFQCDERSIEFNLSWLSKLCLAMQKFSQSEGNRYMLGMLNRNIKGLLHPFLQWYGELLAETSGVPIKVVSGINAHFLGQDKFEKEVITHLETQPGKVIALTSYQTMSSGKNPDYQFNPELENGTLHHVGHRGNDRTDIDFMYLEEPTNLISIEGKPETRTTDRLLLLSYGMALQESGVLTLNQASAWAHDVVTHESPANLCRELKNKFYQKDSDDCLYAVYRIIEQAVGRAARTEMKRQFIHIIAETKLLQLLSNDDRDAALFSHEYRELVTYAKNQFAWLNPPIDRSSRRRQNLALLHTARSLGEIGHMLNLINNKPSDADIEAWQDLRYLTLKEPATVQTPVYLQYYVQSTDVDGYNYTPPTKEWKTSEYRFFEQSISPMRRVSEAKSKLPIFIRNEVVKEHFCKHGFAIQWPQGASYVLTPPMFINIYLGALGEEVGKAVLKHQGFKFEPLAPEHFEAFDEIIVLGDRKALIDFKHWELASWRSLPDEQRKEVMSKFSIKLSALNLNKLVICNMLKQGNEPISYFDSNFNFLPNEVGSSIITLPRLINEQNGGVDIEAIAALVRWMNI
ncbi:hypothetical protein JYB88_03505 [Shewanella cyperi]|uniref:Helicase/UvrB N-terminal domain-containing protein n=1 Tax=Shewanella cyperi TaxID=2814292 RepID=A0A974XLP7_9GAMM|nr:hypothetical protein [Shewanella cyperi]QSX30740.1 hypothetical protein JYB88_03505 [Shewanella cyperi]